MSGAGGAGGADGGGRGGNGGAGGAGGAGNGGGVGGVGNDSTSNSPSSSSASSASSASQAAAASSVGAVAQNVKATVSAVASAVKGLVSQALDSLAPAGTFANSALGQLATHLGVPDAVVQSRLMDVAFTALNAISPGFALANGLATAGQASMAGALSIGITKLAEQHGMPGFAAKAIGNFTAQQLQAHVPAMGVDVSSALRANLGAALDKASQNMGQDFARQVAASVERAVPGATSGQARAGASVWRDALDSGAQQVFGKASAYLSDAMPPLYGNPKLDTLTKALSSGSPPPATPEQSLAVSDPNAYIEQELNRYAAELRQHIRQAMA